MEGWTRLMTNPYFYIIQHRATGLYYAGVRYAKGCDSSDLLTEGGYKTSSKRVISIIENEGIDSFVKRKVKQFGSSAEAIAHEIKFLRRVDARSNKNFINASNNDGGYAVEKENFKKIMLERHGVEHPLQLPNIKEKIKNTCLRKYGTEFATQSNVVKEKIKRTCERKYGTTWLNSEEFKNKRRATMLEKYGVTNSTLKHKESMKSKTSGEKHRLFTGHYVTPNGKYASAYLAIDGNDGLTRKNVYSLCMNPDKIISRTQFSHMSYLRESFGEKAIGKTPRELGFWFEPKQ